MQSRPRRHRVWQRPRRRRLLPPQRSVISLKCGPMTSRWRSGLFCVRALQRRLVVMLLQVALPLLMTRTTRTTRSRCPVARNWPRSSCRRPCSLLISDSIRRLRTLRQRRSLYRHQHQKRVRKTRLCWIVLRHRLIRSQRRR